MLFMQEELDSLLDREHNIEVDVDPANPLPLNNPAYDKIRNIQHTGIKFTPRELFHAIGCKTAALPMNEKDECLKAAYLYTLILDIDGPFLKLKVDYGSDLQTGRSQEIGIGFTCLIGKNYFDIAWDNLCPLPGPGKRFDYSGRSNSYNCIFEAKGTSSLWNQRRQIQSGLDKKSDYHSRQQFFDVELVISTFIGRNYRPRIIIADPDKDSLEHLYKMADDRYRRLRHYCRVLQFIGLPEKAYKLTLFTREYLNLEKKRLLPEKINFKESDKDVLKSIRVNNDEFLGRWFDSWLPQKSDRYKSLFRKYTSHSLRNKKFRLSVFQGVRKDIYESGFSTRPFEHDLLGDYQIQKYNYYRGSRVSVMSDGTILIYKIED